VFSDLRVAALAGVFAILLVGGLIAAAFIGATSSGPPPDLTTPAAMAAATKSLPPEWVVRPGETFTRIAAENHLSVDQLQRLNPAQDPAAVMAGTHLQLHLPTPGVRTPRRVLPRFWTVRRGDTFSSIAAKTGLGVGDIAQFNPTVDPTLLVPGRKLKLHPPRPPG
jgi:LysM repeat protein